MVQFPKKRLRTWRCGACPARNVGGEKKCAACGTRRGTKRRSTGGRCDRLASYLCKALAGFKCSRCNKPGEPNAKGQPVKGLEWSHRNKRRARSVRWDMDNADCFCHDCHSYFETRPVAYAKWMRENGTDPEELERRANEMWDKDYGAVLARLMAIRATLKEKAA
jgi:hypothetical protein